jgi:hypothetical protein
MSSQFCGERAQGGAIANSTVGVLRTKEFKETVKNWTDK